jgi:two-component sensor histidine kinase
MSHVHHLLSDSRGQNIDLRSLCSSLLSHTRALAPHPTPVRLSGPPVPLPPALALPLSLILTEFLTNSAKYGAHSTPSGQVSLSWSLSPAPTPSVGPASADRSYSPPQHSAPSTQHSLLTLHWTESHGPTPPNPHPTPSLGTTLIESFSSRELAGSCSLTYPPSGASHTLSFPLPPQNQT